MLDKQQHDRLNLPGTQSQNFAVESVIASPTLIHWKYTVMPQKLREPPWITVLALLMGQLDH